MSDENKETENRDEPKTSSQATPGIAALQTEHKELGNEIAQHVLAVRNRVDSLDEHVAKYDDEIKRRDERLDELTQRQDDLSAEYKSKTAGTSAPEDSVGLGSPEYKDAMNRFVKTAGTDMEAMSTMKNIFETQVKNVDVGRVKEDPAGGFFVTTTVAAGIREKLESRGRVAQFANTVSIGSDSYTVNVLTGLPNVTYGDEGQTMDDTKGLGFERVNFPIVKATAKPRLTHEALEDPSIDLEAELMRQLADAFLRDRENQYVNGTGGDRPKGFLGAYDIVDDDDWEWGKIGRFKTGAAGAFPTASATKQSLEPIIDMVAAVEDGFEDNAAFLMRKSTIGSVRKLTYTDGTPAWQPSNILGNPQTLHGYPIVPDPHMPAIADDAYAIAFVSQGFYTIVERSGPVMLRDPYTNDAHVKYPTRVRYTGGVELFDRVKVLQFAD